MRTIENWYEHPAQRGEIYELAYLADKNITADDAQTVKDVLDQRSGVQAVFAQALGPRVVRARVLLLANDRLGRMLGRYIMGADQAELELTNVFYVETQSGFVTGAQAYLDDFGSSFDAGAAGLGRDVADATGAIVDPFSAVTDFFSDRKVLWAAAAIGAGVLLVLFLPPRAR